MSNEERFEKLEAELASARRLIRRLMFGAGIFLGICVLLVTVSTITGIAHGQAKEKVIRAEEIRADRFIVDDSQGRQVAMFGMNQDSPALLFGREGSVPRLALLSNGPALYLADGEGVRRIVLTIAGERPSLSLFNRNNMDLVDLALSGDRPCLTLTDDKGNVLWKTP